MIRTYSFLGNSTLINLNALSKKNVILYAKEVLGLSLKKGDIHTIAKNSGICSIERSHPDLFV